MRVRFWCDSGLSLDDWCDLICSWQKQATVKSSVLEVLLEITKYCDLYLMERVMDDESEVSEGLVA